MKTIHWQVDYSDLPKAMHYCKKCKMKTHFVSSNLFRVNAQKRNLDIWLIYKCETCQNTWNVTVHSRVKPQDLPPDALEAFTGNDLAYARMCAMDTALLKRAGAQVAIPDFSVSGDDLCETEPCIIRITSAYPVEIRLGRIICRKLGISQSELQKRMDEGNLRCLSRHDLKKDKLTEEVLVKFRP